MKQDLFERLEKLCNKYGLYYYLLDQTRDNGLLFYKSAGDVLWPSVIDLRCRIFGPDRIYGSDSLQITTEDLLRSEQACHDMVLAFVMEHLMC